MFDIRYSIKHNQLTKTKTMEIKVLSPSCPKWKTLEQATRNAVSELGIDANMSKVENIVQIMH